MKTAQVNTAKN